ncbi:protein translocase subunit SecD [Patescibacteria group bacterium]|nr:protein translocase subunit SecD [Patescibacteria group bacterium]
MIQKKKLKWSLILVILIALTAGFVNLPRVPIKFKVRWFEMDRAIGGNELNLGLFGKEWYKDISLRRGLDLQGGLQVILEADVSEIEEERRDEALDSAREAIERRVNLFGVSESNVYSSRTSSSYRVIVELPGVTDTDEAIKLIGQTAQLEIRELDPEAEEGEFRFIDTGLNGNDLKRAEVVFDPQTGVPQVSLEFTAEGAKKSKEITERNIGNYIGFFLDDLLLSAPTVQSVIEDKGVISGQFKLEDAKRMAIQLNAGALPAPISILSQKQIGATLGEQTVHKGIRAGLVGLGLVFLFMWIIYGSLGFLAGIGLIVYGLVTLALYRLIPVTLTFAGITGFLLSIGMAVDANILIFERYKEETRAGKNRKFALEQAFGRAWDAIRDANVCTLITCFILFNPLEWSFLNISGMVRGFAVTLALGIFVGLFTGVFVTRTLIRVFVR